MKKFFLLIMIFSGQHLFCQDIKTKISLAFKSFEVDSQFEHGIISLYIVDGKTGNTIFDKNASIGLAPASCQKIVISTAAFEILGKDYTYKTQLGYDGKINNGLLAGNIYLIGNGDPTLGSWRYQKTKENIILEQFKKAIKDQGIKQFTGHVKAYNLNWETQSIPGAWIWEDIGNYYGAGASALNWRENQYDLVLKSGRKIGDSVKILSTVPAFLQGVNLINELTSAGAGSGDNSIIYFPPQAKLGYIRGTIPVDEDSFIVSGSMPDGAQQLTTTLYNNLHTDFSYKKIYNIDQHLKTPLKIFFTYASPTLDSINFWFLKKSVNLYGEALLKTIAVEKTMHGSTDTGVNIIKDFWSKRGVEKTALNIVDGSGLSPENRVTATALTTILQYSKKQNWFSYFYDALPEINGIKMKSGSIGGVLSYAGYVKSKNGDDYTFAFIINNCNGSTLAIRQKMWKLLDILK